MLPFPTDAAQEICIPVKSLRAVLEKILVKKSMFQFDAKVAVQRMLESDLFGIPSHGCGRIGEYLDAINVGDVDPRARILTLDDQPAFAVLDGSRSLGQIAATKGMELAIAKARAAGIGFVAIGNSQTLGAASVYARLASEEGLIGICMTSTGGATVAAPGTRLGAIGNTAFAYAVPVTESHPLVFDSACGSESWGKLELLKKYGLPLPLDFGFDANGNLTSDLEKLKVQQPASGLVFGLSLLCSVLAGPLCGGRMPLHKTRSASAEDSQHVLMAINIERFTNTEKFQKEVVSTLSEIREIRPIDPNIPVRIPGDRGANCVLQAESEGVRLHKSVAEDIKTRATALKIEADW